MQTTASIVHEAEVQRQHIRLQLPAEIELQGKRYTTYDWSSGGFAIQLPGSGADELLSRLPVGKIDEGKMRFVFDGFELMVPMQFEVRYSGAQQKRIGCRFTNVDKRHIAIFQYLVSAYVSGEVIQIGDLLDVASRNSFVNVQKLPSADAGLSPAQRMRRRMSRVGWSLLVALVSLGLLFYLVSGIYEHSYVVQAKSAEISADMIVLDSPAGGKVNYVPVAFDTKVKKGEPLISVATDTGALQGIDSPCDCYVKQRLHENSSRVNKGEGLLYLVPVDANPYVASRVAFEDAVKLQTGQKAMLRFPGGDNVPGKVTAIQARDPRGSDKAYVRVETEKPLSALQIDDPVEVKFDTGLFR